MKLGSEATKLKKKNILSHILFIGDRNGSLYFWDTLKMQVCSNNLQLLLRASSITFMTFILVITPENCFIYVQVRLTLKNENGLRRLVKYSSH